MLWSTSPRLADYAGRHARRHVAGSWPRQPRGQPSPWQQHGQSKRLDQLKAPPRRENLACATGVALCVCSCSGGRHEPPHDIALSTTAVSVVQWITDDRAAFCAAWTDLMSDTLHNARIIPCESTICADRLDKPALRHKRQRATRPGRRRSRRSTNTTSPGFLSRGQTDTRPAPPTVNPPGA